ncbi:X-ray repair cross-complementing protein 5 isoform X2 [Protopterus annectens]|uniref:X-ray repair cross-complementing protein 5 isoform X2 n=1 Tax=Protopterus annectens TaxID=7888 RepID=UPI001CFC1735|nr:X-ray repair cross-complementing protein 5 isoform X2 [Protopterus annectens]
MSAVVLCLDVGFSMGRSPPGVESSFDLAKQLVTMFVQRQVFAESKDHVALVLFGTEDTNNALATGEQYQNITVHRHLQLPDFDLLEEIHFKIKTSIMEADILDALVVCMDLLQRESVGRKNERMHIAVFTDLSSPFSSDQLDVIISNLKQASISLQFFLPFPLHHDESKEPGNGPSGDRQRHLFHGKEITPQQKEGIHMVQKVMMAVDEDGMDDVYTFRDSMEHLSIFKKIERKPMAWPWHLTIGSGLCIRIVAYKAVTMEPLKKSWATVDAKTLSKEDIRREVVYCLNDDDETEISSDEIIQGYCYGSDIVPFSKVDQEQMKYKHDGKCFAVLGFTKSSQIMRHHFMGTQALKVFAAKGDEHAAVALSALIHALEEMDMVAIVRYAYDRRANPQVGAAFPCIKDKYECLIYVQLPFVEDLRQFAFASLRNNKQHIPTEEQLSAVDSLIDSMNLVQDEDDEVEDIFKVSKIPNPQFQRLFQCLQHKAFYPDDLLPPMPPHLLSMTERPREVTTNCQAHLEAVKKQFSLQDAGKKKDQKTGHELFRDVNEEPSTKKTRQGDDETEAFSLANISEGDITKVGSVDPAKDFQMLLKQKAANFQEVSQQLQNRIHEQLGMKGLQYYEKGIKCIVVFRRAAVERAEVQCFNRFLQSLKEQVQGGPLKEFWDMIVQENISLISSDEAAESCVTPEESKQFLEYNKMPEETAAAAADGGDVEDLFDMM